MLTITLLKCKDLFQEIELETKYRDFYRDLYSNLDSRLNPEEQANKIEEEAFEMSLKLDLNSVGISDRKIFVIRRDIKHSEHPFSIGNFIIEESQDDFIPILQKFGFQSVEALFGFDSSKMIEGLYFKPDWDYLESNIKKIISEFNTNQIVGGLVNFELFKTSILIIESTIELVKRQSDKQNYYLQWIYN